MRKIIVLPFAEQDIKDSVEYCAENQEGLGKEFLIILDQAFHYIESNPHSFPLVKNQIRKFVVKDFPFNVYYIYQEETIYILGVFHNKRDPKDWITRKLK